MRTLRPYQSDIVDRVRNAYLHGYKAPCVVLPCGGGKSVIVAEIAKRTTAKQNHVLFLVHRKELVDQIQNTFDFWGVDMNNADIMMVQTASRRIDSIEYPSLIITDECFPAGTMVDDKPIEEITPGDYVSSYNEINGTIEKKRVIAVMKNPMPDQLVEIDSNLLSTLNHPIYEPLEGRYIDAGSFKQGQFTLHCVQYGTFLGTAYKKSKKYFSCIWKNTYLLLKGMFQRILSSYFLNNDGENQSKVCIGANEEKQSFQQSGCQGKDIGFPKRKAFSGRTWRKWQGYDRSADDVDESTESTSTRSGICCKNDRDIEISSCLQGGCRFTEQNDCCGSGRKQSSFFKSKRSRRKKNFRLRAERVESVTIHKSADLRKSGRLRGENFVYNLEVEDTHNYFANGILVHNCHHSKATTYRKIYDAFPNAHRLGVTATPVRLDGSGLGDVNDILVEGVSAKWLIEHHYLAPYDYYAPSIADLTGIKIQHGEYETKSVEKALLRTAVFGDAIKHYRQLADGKQAICYCVSVNHSYAMAEEFKANGIAAEHIDGTTPKEQRDHIIERYRRGEITILCNVDLISEGFDVPDCECAILLRPTKSLTLYIQQSMRCMRYKKGKRAIIIDHVGNYARHGMPDADRKWDLHAKKAAKKQEKQAEDLKIKQCPECYYTFEPPSFGRAVCPACGYMFPKQERSVEHEEDTELKQITGFVLDYDSPDQCRNMHELQQYAKKMGYKPGWSYYQGKKRGFI